MASALRVAAGAGGELDIGFLEAAKGKGAGCRPGAPDATSPSSLVSDITTPSFLTPFGALRPYVGC